MDDSLAYLTTKELQSLLRKRNLPIYYKLKSDLITRLQSSMNKEKVEDNINENLDSEKEESIEEKSEEEISDSEEEETEHTMSSFTFKDVESSMKPFSGENEEKNVKKWMENFEKTSDIYKWADIQKYMYCRHLLNGAAKLAVEAEDCTSWETLKKILIEEFSEEISAIEIHKLLSKTKKTDNETFIQYFYKIKKIAKEGKLDEKSIIEYTIAGIKDYPSNKVILYNAKNEKELKQQSQIYERMKADFKHLKEPSNSNNTNNYQKPNQIKQKTIRCFNCGSSEHKRPECKEITKCFKCRESGHNSKDCPQNRSQDVNTISTTKNNTSTHKLININGIEINSLIDTGY